MTSTSYKNTEKWHFATLQMLATVISNWTYLPSNGTSQYVTTWLTRPSFTTSSSILAHSPGSPVWFATVIITIPGSPPWLVILSASLTPVTRPSRPRSTFHHGLLSGPSSLRVLRSPSTASEDELPILGCCCVLPLKAALLNDRWTE